LKPSSSEAGPARAEAFRILRRVDREGAFAGVLLESAERRLPDRRDAALLHEIVLGVLRFRDAIDHALAGALDRGIDSLDPPVLTALRIGAHSILYLERVPPFAAVATAVDLARAAGRAGSEKLVNAVLRRVAREGASLLPVPPREGDVPQLALFHSHPLWWTRRAVARLGWDGASRLLEANNRPAATVLRPNLRKTTPRDLARRLEAEGVATEPCRFVPEALRVVSGRAQHTESFRSGFAWVQDEASQLVPMLLGRVLGPRVLDLCAAPGAKTVQIAECLVSGGFVVASDRNPARLRRLAENVRRLGAASVLPVCCDATRPCLSATFDEVLVDAPCSGTGTLRRHPEIRWRLTEGDLEPLAASQRAMLEAGAARTARGGTLVYSVCSLEEEEGPEVVEAFLRDHPEWRIHERGALRTSPADGGLDGFFAAAMTRAR
jgi:16S rRNA (cytosine967-C5)-methyltransferase